MSVVGDQEWDVDDVVQFIVDTDCRNVALQFPRDLISSAHAVVRSVKDGLDRSSSAANIFLLADVARHGSTVDVVAADHLDADAIVQFGDASREPVTNRPVLHVLSKKKYKLESLVGHVNALSSSTGKKIVVILDGPYAHLQSGLSAALEGDHVQVCKSPFEVLQGLSAGPGVAGTEQSGNVANEDRGQHLLWVGTAAGSTTLDYALVACGPTDWHFLDPATDSICSELPHATQKLLMRRRFLVHKAEDAGIVGILVSTIAIHGWKRWLQQVKTLAKAAGKKTYTIFLGKPAPEKLANFPEVNVWVQISDPAGFVWNSKPYLAPVIAPAEAVEAWKGRVAEAAEGAQEPADAAAGGGEAEGEVPRSTVTVQPAGGVLTATRHSAADYFLQKRTFTGVETPATGAPIKAPELAVQGRSGRAAVYDSEPQQ
eukprot:jgi/Ulvmu1/2971/UM015_0011.1